MKKSLSAFFILLLSFSLFSKNKNLPPKNFVFVEGDSEIADFYIQKTELNQKFFKKIMGFNPSFNKNNSHPVEGVSWFDSIYFCNVLSIKQGRTPCYTLRNESDPAKWNYTPGKGLSIDDSKEISCNFSANGYRLPTMKEWQYAACSGKYNDNFLFSGSNDVNKVAWYRFNSSSHRKCGTKKPNRLGIYDMSGNVWEWCWDQFPNIKDYRYYRGGSFINIEYYSKIFMRYDFYPSSGRYEALGIRLVCTADSHNNIYKSKSGVLSSAYSSFIDEPVILPKGTDGTAGKKELYVLFGEWPQSIKADCVQIDESKMLKRGMFDFYSGSDGCYYVKSEEKAFNSNCKYSDGSEVKKDKSSFKYFKVEPIKWRVLTSNYQGSGKSLLISEKILDSGTPFYTGIKERTINDNQIFANNYLFSTIRGYLNGLYDFETTGGFLQTAFSNSAQNRIFTTEVDNSVIQMSYDGTNGTREIYACENTLDKVFLPSTLEIIEAGGYGFSKYDQTDNLRIKNSTDFALARGSYQSVNKNYGGYWWTRSPYYCNYFDVRYVSDDGRMKITDYVYNKNDGIVPAICLEL